MVAMTQENVQLKIAIVGSSCIGKTCMVQRFLENTFHGSVYNPTPGIDFGSRRIILTKPVPTAVTIIIFDIGGTAIGSKMLHMYLKSNIDIIMLAYDMTTMGSLNELRNWMDVLQGLKLITSDSSKSLVLVGCKGDLEHLRTVRLDTHTKFTQEYGISLSFIVSAKSGESVQTCFTSCVSYHLNPDSKKPFVREHLLTHGQLPKKLSAAMSSTNPHAMPAGSSASNNSAVGGGLGSAAITSAPLRGGSSNPKTKQQMQSATAGTGAAAEENKNDLNSTVCTVQ